MFWTAFIWGLGVSCGAAFGLILFVALKCVWDLTVNSKPVKRANELAEKHIEHLATIASSLEDLELSNRK